MLLYVEQRRDLLEIMDDRYQKRSTIITSQLPAAIWHEYLNDATLADAILDRLMHNATKSLSPNDLDDDRECFFEVFLNFTIRFFLIIA